MTAQPETESRPATPTGGGPARGRLLDGKAVAAEVRADLGKRVRALAERGVVARLDAVIAQPDDSPAGLYASRQQTTCEALGIEYRLHRVASDAGTKAVLETIRSLNADESVHAIMVHMPLPDETDEMVVKAAIDPEKDVEGVTPANIGNIVYGRGSLAPCTGLAAVELIDRTGIDLRGKRAVVVGASDTVGKPIAAMLMRRDATVVSCNKWTRGLEDLCRSADVLVAAVGLPDLISPEMVQPGAVVIDVGVNRVTDDAGNTRTVGDVSFDRVRPLAGWISPVPGGVGPVTVAMLLRNVVLVSEAAATRASGER